MSATVAMITVETVILAVVVLFVVALLRSHAEILRRLHAVENRASEPAESKSAESKSAESKSAESRSPESKSAAGPVVRDLVGETLSGDAVKLALGAGAPPTLLAFLSSGCGACGPLWSALRDGARVPLGTRLVVVTKGPERESITRLSELAPPEHELVMSTATWDELSVPATPHFVLVDGDSGRIAGRGTGISWEQIVTLVERADGDRARHATRARSSSARAARAEEALAAAEIVAGHPSLYPSRAGVASDEQPSPYPSRAGVASDEQPSPYPSRGGVASGEQP
jgi:hypothetical protein